jgi:hypothetical protein
MFCLHLIAKDKPNNESAWSRQQVELIFSLPHDIMSQWIGLYITATVRTKNIWVFHCLYGMIKICFPLTYKFLNRMFCVKCEFLHDIVLYFIFHYCILYSDRLCGLVIRLPGCRPRGPGFDSQCCQIFWLAVSLKWGPLSPCEDKWGATWKKSSGSDLENWD